MSTPPSPPGLGRRFYALWTAQMVSQFGTSVALLTIPLLILQMQGGAGGPTSEFSYAYALETAPVILVGLAGGLILDRVKLSSAMITADLSRAAAFFYLASQASSTGLGTVLAVAFLAGWMASLFDAAMFSVVPSLAPAERLSTANSYITVAEQVNFALGPLAAGLLFAASGDAALGLGVNGASFIVSAAALMFIGDVPKPEPDESEPSQIFQRMVRGFRYVWDEPRLRATTAASTVSNFVIGFVEATFVVLATVVLGVVDESRIGVLFSAMGVGGLVGAFLAPRVVDRLGLGRTMIAGLGFAGVMFVTFLFSSFGVLAITLVGFFMVGLSVVNIPLTTIRQKYTPKAMLGRVIAASRAVGWATLPVGALVGGWLGNSPESYPWVARSFSLLLVACALWLVSTVVWRATFGDEEPLSRA